MSALVAVTGGAERPLPPIEPVIAWTLDGVVILAVAATALATAAAVARRGMRDTAARRLRA